MGFKQHPFYVDIMEYDGMYKQHYGSLWYFGSFEEKGVTFFSKYPSNSHVCGKFDLPSDLGHIFSDKPNIGISIGC